MLLESFLHTRPDRLIAMGRAALATFALAAIWMDPSQPATTPELAYGLLLGYLAFAIGVLFASRRESVWSPELAVANHLIDLTVFSTLTFLTEGPTSPFFLLFTFSLVNATFRWKWKGALWTAVTALVLLLATAAAYRGLAPDLPFESDRFIIRCAHFVVIGAMLVYFGFRYQHLAEEATRIAAWHPDPSADTQRVAFLEAYLAHVAHVFAAPRALLVVEDEEERRPSIGVWSDGGFRQDRLAAGSIDSLVPEALAKAGFIRTPAGDVLVASRPGRLSLWQGSPMSPALEAYGLDRVLSVPVQAERTAGRLFVADRADFSREDLTLAWLVAAQIAGGLDRIQVIETMKQSIALEERLRLARDLHDGILQTLAGTALQLEAVKKSADQDPGFVRSRIDAIQASLLVEQREMRCFIGKLRPGAAPSEPAKGQLDFAELARSLEQQWGVTIRVSGAPDLKLPAHLDFHARQIVREAVANGVRHGKASAISLDARQVDGQLSLTIANNGGGLAEHGRFDTRQCAELRIGPRSLRERVISLGGSLIFDSTPPGVTLSVDLPLREHQQSR